MTLFYLQIMKKIFTPFLIDESNFWFLMDNKTLEYFTNYKYLDTTIDEFLQFDFCAGVMTDSAGRSLAALITKMIKNGGFPLNVFQTLYDASVCSVRDVVTDERFDIVKFQYVSAHQL